MSEIINGSFQQQLHNPNPSLHSLFHALDPISLILSQNSNPANPLPLKLTTESFVLERGPRYRAYAQLRDSRLRMRQLLDSEFEEPQRQVLTPPPAKKQVRFQGNLPATGRKGSSSVLAQSVPDFSAALRKENRKPTARLPPTLEMTPPPAASKNWAKANGSSARGSKSSSAAEKRGGGGGGARKSYASFEELKGLSSAAATAINGENRAAGRKTVLGSYRPF